MATVIQLFQRPERAGPYMQQQKVPPEIIREEHLQYRVFNFYHRMMSTRPHEAAEFYAGAEA